MSELPLGVDQDRRRSERHPVDVSCQAVADYDFCLLGDAISELSGNGLMLRSDGTPAEVGETVLVSFRPPGSACWIDAEATVVRLVTGTQRGAPALGLELQELSPFEEGLLSGSLEASHRKRIGPRPVVEVKRRHHDGVVVERSVVRIGPTHPQTIDGIARMVIVT